VSAHDPVLVITLPKTGTNLLLKCIKLITGNSDLGNVNFVNDEQLRNNSILWAHQWGIKESRSIEPTQEKISFISQKGFKVLLINRDPRDHLCSMIRRIYKRVTPKLLVSSINDSSDLLGAVTDRTEFWSKYRSLNDLYFDYLKWEDLSFVYQTSFERLVGPHGGGSLDAQIDEILNIAKHIGVEINNERAKEIVGDLFGNTSTFRLGQISDWKNRFNDDVKKLFKEKHGDLLIQIGYEDDNNW
jgi:hypothetical protein